MRRHSPIQQLHEAKQIARDHNMFIVEKPAPEGTDYIVYRKTPCGNTRLGARRDIGALRRFVAKAAETK